MLGGCLLLRRAMLDELGGFDEGFRMYGEDIDLCYRAAKAGWERWYVPAAVVRHAGRGRPTSASSRAHALALARHRSASSASTPSGSRLCEHRKYDPQAEGLDRGRVRRSRPATWPTGRS